MLYDLTERPMLNLVWAVFQSSAAFFEEPRITRFGDLPSACATSAKVVTIP